MTLFVSATLVKASAAAAALASALASVLWFVIVARISIAHELGSASCCSEIQSVSMIGSLWD
jgi:hypothetical protein